MQFRSTKSNNKEQVSFKEAILHCLPQDGGLYVPSSVMDMRHFFLHMDSDTAYYELVSTIAPVLLQGELNPLSASRVVESAFNFEPELKQLDEHFSILNLHNGPTGVFKDFGIAFLAAVIEELTKNNSQVMTLSAVRGNTGVSIAHAFYKRQNVVPVILYPSGPIHGLNPETFIQNGGNIIPVQVKGTFDDCQRLIRETINDLPFSNRYNITTADTLNPGRLLPQTFYYLYAFIKIKKYLKGELIFSVPCGNFGNLISGLYAWKFGMPVNGFIAAMNINNTFGDFIKGKNFLPKRPVSTISPALDIGFPSNYERLFSFYEESPAVMRNMVFPSSIDDRTTMETINDVWKKYNVLIDPHTAVAFASAKNIGESHGMDAHFVVLATSHPAKFQEVVSKAIGQEIQVPERLKTLRKKSEPIAIIDPQIDALESAIASCF